MYKNQSAILRFPLILQALCWRHLIFGDLDEGMTSITFIGQGIETIDDDVGRLESLVKLNLDQNLLISLPAAIGKLKSLQILSLYMNKLTSIPNAIGGLKNLQILDLRENKLTSLPCAVEDLSDSLVSLDLRGNDISEVGEEGVNFGKKELREIFKKRVMLDIDTVDVGKYEITTREVYNDIKKQPIYWNFNLLRTLRPAQIPISEFSEKELMSIWNESISRLITIDENREVMEEFIHHIYNPEKEYKRWAMPVKDLDLAKNLIGSIFDILSKVVDDDQKIVSNINEICEGLLHCPDRQVSEMMFAYYLLADRVDPNSSLEDFVKCVIGQEKEKVFGFTITPVHTYQNVHVLNYWKYELRNEVGFDFNFKTRYGTMRQDRFNGWRGNALRAFYFTFTPEFVIVEVTERINSNGPMLCKALELLYNDESIGEDEKRRMYVSDTDEEDTILYAKAITGEFVEYFLLEMGVFVKRQEESFLQRWFTKVFDLLLMLLSWIWRLLSWIVGDY